MPHWKRSAVAAVANKDERQNDKPDPVVVKQVAQTSIIHKTGNPPRRLGKGKLNFLSLLPVYVEFGILCAKSVAENAENLSRVRVKVQNLPIFATKKAKIANFFTV